MRLHQAFLIIALTLISVCAGFMRAAEDPLARWAAAIGGRGKIASIDAVYREAVVEAAGYRGTLKVWHTADGKYRKEEQIGDFATVEAFDGHGGLASQGATPLRVMTDAEVEQTKSKRSANSNAMFFVFFP